MFYGSLKTTKHHSDILLLFVFIFNIVTLSRHKVQDAPPQLEISRDE